MQIFTQRRLSGSWINQMELDEVQNIIKKEFRTIMTQRTFKITFYEYLCKERNNKHFVTMNAATIAHDMHH